MRELTTSFPVHGYEVDAFGVLAAPSLAGYLQEAAGLHAEILGVGTEALRQRGLAWVLGRQRIEISHPIREREVVEVETWPSGADRLQARREFVLRRAGEEVARATTAWFLIDLDRRRPARPDRVLDSTWLPEATHALPLPEARIPDPTPGGAERRFLAGYASIDRNLHATNSAYLGWALEAVPEPVWASSRLRSIQAQYLAECHQGSAVLSRAEPEAEGAFRHLILREEDGKALCRLRTAWVPRAG